MCFISDELLLSNNIFELYIIFSKSPWLFSNESLNNILLLLLLVLLISSDIWFFGESEIVWIILSIDSLVLLSFSFSFISLELSFVNVIWLIFKILSKSSSSKSDDLFSPLGKGTMPLCISGFSVFLEIYLFSIFSFSRRIIIYKFLFCLILSISNNIFIYFGQHEIFPIIWYKALIPKK